MKEVVDPGVLDGIAKTLRNASSHLDELAGSVPGVPDAGDGTPAVTGILAWLTEGAGQMVVGMGVAGDTVSSSNSDYRETDHRASDNLKAQGK